MLGTISWSDIGLSGAGELSRQEMLVSTDGSHWSSIPAPAVGSVINLVAGSDGFLLLADNTAPTTVGAAPKVETTLLHSTDARTWTTVGVPDGLNVQSIAGDRIIGTDATGALQTSTDGGATWNATSIDALLPAGTPTASITASDAGPLGFAAFGHSRREAERADDPGPSTCSSAPTGSTGRRPTSRPWATRDRVPDAGHGRRRPRQHRLRRAGATVAGGPAKITTLLATPQR